MPRNKTNPHQAFNPAEQPGADLNLDNGPHGWFSNHWVMYDLGSECSSVASATESSSKRSAPSEKAPSS